MKPNYCSGGAILSSLNNSVSDKSSRSNSGASNGGSQCKSVARRQQLQQPVQQQQSKNNGINSFCYTTAAAASESATSATTRPSSPFIVYRSAKYIKPHARLLKRVHGYAKYYVVIPVIRLANQCKLAFYQLCGLLLLLVASPVLMLILLGLFVVRRLRILLIQRLYPGLLTVDGLSNSYKCCEKSQSLGVDIVNSVVWTRGKIDVDTIRKRFRLLFTENPELQHLLGLRLVSKLGVILWETSDSNVLEDRIVEAPKMFHNCPIVDEPLKELYRTGSNKSILQKYISYCVSIPLEPTAPPWKIHLISYISREDGIKEKTCLVIRMHAAIFNDRQVRKALHELFVNSTFTLNDTCDAKPDETRNNNLIVLKSNDDAKDKIPGARRCESVAWNLGKFEFRPFCIGEKIKEISFHHQKNLGTWFALRLKQLEFHSKTFVMSIILVDIRNLLKRCASYLEVVLYELWISVLSFLKYVIGIMQALAAVPMIILGSVVRRTNFNKLGLRLNSNNTKRLISWSEIIYDDLVQEICKKTGTTSVGNVLMMACSYALSDYYQQNNIPDPENIGFTVGDARNTLISAPSLKSIRVPCNKCRYPVRTLEDLQIIEQSLEKYPNWKLLGLWYTMQYSSYFMPTCIFQIIQRRIVSCFPFLFTHLNLNLVAPNDSYQEPIHQLYGEIVEEFSFWQLPPLSNFGVSITLVQYGGKTRLFVMSPFQSMDTILTQRCNQYLIRIAEDVGVERCRIPYSRRSSPASTSCSTPQIPSYIFNHSEK